MIYIEGCFFLICDVGGETRQGLEGGEPFLKRRYIPEGCFVYEMNSATLGTVVVKFTFKGRASYAISRASNWISLVGFYPFSWSLQ